jgi:hypothetical protein
VTRIETVTTPPIPGAARRISYIYWPPTVQSVPNFGNTDAFLERPYGIREQFGNFTTTGAPPAPDGAVIYKGRPAISITSNLVTGRILTPSFAVNRALVMVPFQNVKGTGDFARRTVDDYAIWSASVVLAFDPIPGVIVGDIGLVLGPGTRFTVRAAVNQFGGIEFGPLDTGVLGVTVRQTDLGPITFNQAIPDQPDMTEWHSYEIRLYSATSTTEATARFYLDGKQQLSLPWGAGTVLPEQVIGAAGNLGFTPGIGNFEAFNGTTRMYVAQGTFTVKVAPDEASLL